MNETPPSIDGTDAGTESAELILGLRHRKDELMDMILILEAGKHSPADEAELGRARKEYKTVIGELEYYREGQK